MSYFIKGERLYLREVRITDVCEEYYQWMNDPAISQFLETRFIPRSLDNIKEYVQSLDGKTDEIFCAICLLKNHEYIGNIKLGPINWYHRKGDISYFIGKKMFWGNGYAGEAIHCMLDFAVRNLNLHKFKAGCYAQNKGSVKVLEKLGFKKEGILKKEVFHNGAYEDLFLFGLLTEDYLGMGNGAK